MKELSVKYKAANVKVKDLLMASKSKDEKIKDLEEAISTSK